MCAQVNPVIFVGLQLVVAGGGEDSSGAIGSLTSRQPTRGSQSRPNSVRMCVAVRSGEQDGLSALWTQAINIVSIGDALFERVAAHACAGVWDLVKTVKLIDCPPVRQTAILCVSLC